MDNKSLKDISVLIVDDEESICDILKEELILFGANASIAKSGEQAYEMLKKENYHYVITDIKMPNGDGISLIKKINENLNYKPKIYICTGYHTLTNEEIKSLNITSVLEKPFSINEFLRSLYKDALKN
jgi:DNA-binding response OmpR family regulator